MLLIVIQQPLRNLLPQHLHLVLRLGSRGLPLQQANQFLLLLLSALVVDFNGNGLFDDGGDTQDVVVPRAWWEDALVGRLVYDAVGLAAALLAGGSWDWRIGCEGFGGAALTARAACGCATLLLGGRLGGGFVDGLAADLLVVGFEDVLCAGPT